MEPENYIYRMTGTRADSAHTVSWRLTTILPVSIIDCSIESASKRERLMRFIHSRSVDVWENEGGAIDEHVPTHGQKVMLAYVTCVPVRDLFGWTRVPATK